MPPAVIETVALTKRYGRLAALDAVSLTVQPGDVYGLVGQNGAGKTTLFKCLLGLAKPTEGAIRLLGASGPGDLDRMRRQVGFLVTPSFYPYLDASANLAYLCRARGIEAAGEVPRLLALVGLAEARQPYRAFSYGMRQRLGLAAALLGSPPLVILDEPVNGLDPQGIVDIRNILKAYNAQTGATLVVSSHILGELDLLATRFGFLEQGRLLLEVSHQELHAESQAALLVEVDDVGRALQLLTGLGMRARPDGGRLVVSSHLDQASRIARLLVEEGLELSRLERREGTLEDFFLRLIGRRDA